VNATCVCICVLSSSNHHHHHHTCAFSISNNFSSFSLYIYISFAVRHHGDGKMFCKFNSASNNESAFCASARWQFVVMCVREFAGGTKCQRAADAANPTWPRRRLMIRLKLNSTHTPKRALSSLLLFVNAFCRAHYLRCTFSRSPHPPAFILFSQKTPTRTLACFLLFVLLVCVFHNTNKK